MLASFSLTHSPTTTSSFSRLHRHFRVCDHPYGLLRSLSTLHLFCSLGFTQFRHRRKTRYGLLARNYPTATSTLQDAPSFAWRDNVTLKDEPRSSESSPLAGEFWAPCYVKVENLLNTNLLFKNFLEATIY
jgi:hypothetical protein